MDYRARPMRVALVAQGRGEDLATWSGIPARLGRALQDLGHDVRHVSADPPRTVLRGAVTLVRVAGVRQPGASHGPELAALRTRVVRHRLRARREELVVQLDTGFRLPAGTRYVTYHDMTVAQGIRAGWSDPALMGRRPRAAWLRRDEEICRGATACCAASSWTTASLIEDYGIAVERAHAIGFGRAVASEPAGPAEERAPHFLFVGREWERKNGPAVVRAFATLRAERPDARLTLVGEHPRVVAEGVDDVGPLPAADPASAARLAALYGRATCFVLPSLMEPFGMAYLEAGAAGVPSIGTTVGGAASAIGDGGLLVEPGDDGALLDAMRQMCDPTVARALGAAARRHSDRHDWRSVAQRLLSAADSSSR